MTIIGDAVAGANFDKSEPLASQRIPAGELLRGEAA
jgi:hypothetical protein